MAGFLGNMFNAFRSSPAKEKVSQPRSTGAKDEIRKLRKKEPRELEDIVQSMEKDYQFQLGFLTIKALIESANISIEVEGDEKAERLAENLQDVFDNNLSQILTAFGYGRACFEKVFQIDKGLVVLNDLDFLPFVNTEMEVSPQGEFTGVTVKGKSKIHLAPQKVWWFALDPTPTEPHGRSRYLGAPLEILGQRNRLLDNENIWLERFALGQGKARAPEKYEIPKIYDSGDLGEVGNDGQLRNPMEDLEVQVDAMRSGGTLTLSSAKDKDGAYLFDYEALTMKGESAPLENKRRELDAAALRSLGIPERAITQDSSTGSLSLANVHMQMLFSTVEGILSQIVASYQKFVIDKISKFNYPASMAPDLNMVWQPLRESERDQQITEIVTAIIQSPSIPPMISEGIVDLGKMMEIADLPLGENFEQKLKGLKEEQKPKEPILPFRNGRISQ